MTPSLELGRPTCPVLMRQGELARMCFFRIDGRCCHAALDKADECPQQRIGAPHFGRRQQLFRTMPA